MKIAYIVPSLKNKGPIIVVKDLTDVLVKINGITCEVFYFDEGAGLTFNCKTTRLNTWQQIAEENFDIIHTHMLRPDLFYARHKNKLRNATALSTMHNYMYADLKNSYGAFTAFLTRLFWCNRLLKFDKIACLSNDMVNYYSKYINKEKLICIYNGRNLYNEDDSVIEPLYKLEEIETLKKKYQIIGGIGFLTKRKGFDQLIQALAKNNSLALVLIGDGPEKNALQELAKKLRIGSRCIFLGENKNAAAYYRYFDVYAVTSLSEGFPLVLLEAAAHGVPVVCSNIPALREVFSEQEVCYYQLFNIESLVNAIANALNNSANLSNNILIKYKTSYTAQVMANNYLHLYKRLSKNAAG